MSFSTKVKEEIAGQISSGRHCRVAEIAGIISMCGKIQISLGGRYSVKVCTENIFVARKYGILLSKTFQIKAQVSVRQNSYYTVIIKNQEDALRVLQAVRIIDFQGKAQEDMSLTDAMVIRQDCCKRAFIRGAFLTAGSISDPEKFYHLEIVCITLQKAAQLCKIIQNFQIDAKIVERKRHFVVYIKEGSGIVDILNVMEAHVALMDLENVRIVKEVRNSVNRKVNCETANLNKTVSAAVRQIEDIQYIRDTKGLSFLSETLEEMARVRLEYPEASLKELGALFSPPMGKSGVNHRLRKICEIADYLRKNEEESYGHKKHDYRN